ncbi:hypothetical protein PENTCL1PPCAC_14096, partial [Pristionchus entomophagus]
TQFQLVNLYSIRLFTSAIMVRHHKVTIVGSGNWGSAIARIVGNTATENPGRFHKTVRMFCRPMEMEDGRQLHEIINEDHENVKYLPGKRLPKNVVAVPDLLEACTDATILIFVIPHQFIADICKQLQGHIVPGAQAISLSKGLSTTVHKHRGIKLISEEITQLLGIDCNVLMGANLAPEVADDKFCEATIGCSNKSQYGQTLNLLFQTPNFRITVVEDAPTVELCGALKNIVACAAGFTDGLGYGDNTKAAVIRLGMMEMTKFVEHFYPGSNLQTFFESCGIADLITTCYGGRNRRVCEAFVIQKKPVAQIEKELLNGQSAQGPLTAEEVYDVMEKSGLCDKFPLFTAVHRICTGDVAPESLIDCLRNHPEHM